MRGAHLRGCPSATGKARRRTGAKPQVFDEANRPDRRSSAVVLAKRSTTHQRLPQRWMCPCMSEATSDRRSTQLNGTARIRGVYRRDRDSGSSPGTGPIRRPNVGDLSVPQHAGTRQTKSTLTPAAVATVNAPPINGTSGARINFTVMPFFVKSPIETYRLFDGLLSEDVPIGNTRSAGLLTNSLPEPMDSSRQRGGPPGLRATLEVRMPAELQATESAVRPERLSDRRRSPGRACFA